MKKQYIFLLAILLLLVVGYFVMDRVNKPARNLANATANMTLTAPKLYGAYVENENLANQQYLDKVVEVRGILQDVSRGNDRSLNLTLDAGSPMGGVTCEVPGENIPEGLNLKMGNEITVKGQCTGFLMDVVLVKCVIQP